MFRKLSVSVLVCLALFSCKNGAKGGDAQSQGQLNASMLDRGVAARPSADKCEPLNPYIRHMSTMNLSSPAGGTLEYTFTVNNMDSAACQPKKIELSTRVPTGWSASLNPSITSLTLRPGEVSDPIVMSVTSAASSTKGNYPAWLYGFAAVDGLGGGGGVNYEVLGSVVPDCTPSNPSTRMEVMYQSGAAGSTVAYVFTVRNTDSAGCAKKSIALSSMVPDGWAAKLDVNSIELSPGEVSGPMTFAVTSSTSAAAGKYSVTVSALAPGGLGGMTTAVDEVLAGGECVRLNPHIRMDSYSQSGFAGSTVTYSFTVKNMDSASCAAKSIALSNTVPDGWSGSLTQSSLSLAPGQTSGSIAFAVTSNASSAPGKYRVGVSAFAAVDGLGGGSFMEDNVILPTTPPASLQR